jgi:hypothetical protein
MIFVLRLFDNRTNLSVSLSVNISSLLSLLILLNAFFVVREFGEVVLPRH